MFGIFGITILGEKMGYCAGDGLDWPNYYDISMEGVIFIFL